VLTDTKHKPNSEHSPSTETNTDHDTEAHSHIKAQMGDDINVHTTQTMEGSATAKRKEAGQRCSNPDKRLE
jgi:hypothetical protein